MTLQQCFYFPPFLSHRVFTVVFVCLFVLLTHANNKNLESLRCACLIWSLPRTP